MKLPPELLRRRSTPSAIGCRAGRGRRVGLGLAVFFLLTPIIRLHAAPPIEIQRLGPGFVEVSWPQTEGIVALEASPNLRILTWLPVPSPPALIGGRHRVTVPTAPGQGYFRLRSNAALYIVNMSDDFVSFADFQTATGNVPPTTRLSLGTATDLFQPRATVVTASGRLLISRGNGGIVGWNDAKSATGTKFRDIEVDGAATGLGAPISFAYDRDDDRLFVGTIQSDLGIVIFDNVSGVGFNGNIAPSRVFSPEDRFPNATSGSIKMTIDAFRLDEANDRLYVVDTSGLSQNSSRILVYNTPGTKSGKVNPSRTLTATTAPNRWTQVRSIEIVNNRLYAVDDSNVLFIVNNINSADGNVTPTRVTVQGNNVHLRSVIAFDGALYFLDENNASILVLPEIPTGNTATVAPHRIITGSATRLRLPSYMYISRGYLDP